MKQILDGLLIKLKAGYEQHYHLNIPFLSSLTIICKANVKLTKETATVVMLSLFWDMWKILIYYHRHHIHLACQQTKSAYDTHNLLVLHYTKNFGYQNQY